MSNALTPTAEQQEWIDQFVNSSARGGILGLGTGVGKTLVSIEIARLRGAKRVLIMAPDSTFDGWADHVWYQTGRRLKRCANSAHKFTHHPDSSRRNPSKDNYLSETVKLTAAQCKSNLAKCQAGEDGWYFVTRELFTLQTWFKIPVRKGGQPVIDPKTGKQKMRAQRKDVWDKKRPFDMVILDENQRFATKGNRGQQSFAALSDQTFKLASSQDWFGSALENMHTVAHDVFGAEVVGMNKAQFKDAFMETEFDPFTYDKKRVTGEQIPGLFASTLPLYVTAPPSVKPPKPDVRYIDLSRQERSLYDQLEKNYVAIVGDKVLNADIPLTLRIRLRELALGMFEVEETGKFTEDGIEKTTIRYQPGAKSTKIDEIKSIMADHPGQHLLVLTHSAKWAHKAAIDLGGEAWTGQETKAERAEIKARFLSGETKVIVAVFEAMAEGTNGLQYVCNRVVIASRTDQSLMIHQGISRVARTGQEKQVDVIELVARDTFDEGVLHAQGKAIRQRAEAKGWGE